MPVPLLIFVGILVVIVCLLLYIMPEHPDKYSDPERRYDPVNFLDDEWV